MDLCYNSYMSNKENKIIIFSDGASKGNPGPGGFGAVIVLPEEKVIELGGYDKHTTNNRMELSGAVKALSHLPPSDEGGLREVDFYTDSKYVINGMTGWIYGWQKNGWQTKDKHDVLNKDLWEKLFELSQDKKIKWQYVGGHVGVAGNERCDEIADAMATRQKVDLYSGSLAKYKINILDLGHDEGLKKNKYSKSAKAYSYLSLVDGVFKIDKVWADCEKRVTGKKNPKYQKAISPEHEKEIMKNWGVHE
jgi:ribonuclease HI